MDIDITEYLNPKIEHHCLKLFENGHYTECAHTAMKQVEVVINQKCGIDDFSPAGRTIDRIFSSGRGIRLRIPFGDKQAENAKILFKGAFKYYRNYTAHQQENITKQISLRVMCIASELLDFLGACYLNLEELGGLEEIKNVLDIQDNQKLKELLCLMDNYWFPEDICDGFFEDLANGGFSDEQYHKLFELDLVYCEEIPCENPPHDIDPDPPLYLTYFRLTDIGKQLLKEIRR